jgi:multiple sugar transport system permease protein
MDTTIHPLVRLYRKHRARLGVAFFTLLAAAFVAFALAPFLWLAISSLKTPQTLYRSPPTLWPNPVYVKHYLDAFVGRPFAWNIYNSAVVAGSSMLVSLVIGSLAAYALGRLQFPGKKIILTMVLAVSMFPGISIVAPLYLWFSNFGIINTKLALVLPYVTFSLPLCIWTLTAFFQELPFELEEAAKVDGATPMQTFAKVIVPLAAPGVFTCAILVFIYAWNEFLFARTFMNREISYTITVALQMFQGMGEEMMPWGQISAASIIVSVPLVLIVLLFQRRIVSGLTSGGVKG